jgi:two-component system, chemotaxis family, chemotaxis protein CheY
VEPSRSVPGAPHTRQKCILVVDDEDAIREVVAETLELEGYHVERAHDGQQGLAKLRASRPDAVILDLMMPVMDGWTFLQQCRNDDECRGTPVLVMSAYRRLAETARELRVPCVAKPFDLDIFLTAVERLLSGASGDRGTAASGA